MDIFPSPRVRADQIFMNGLKKKKSDLKREFKNYAYVTVIFMTATQEGGGD